MHISTHAPLAGSDLALSVNAERCYTFQPTLPSRGATWRADNGSERICNFNPRSPRGERRAKSRMLPSTYEFQPTLPSRGATRYALRNEQRYTISTHAPLAGSDDVRIFMDDILRRFQPTLPSRGATSALSGRNESYKNFNPRSPRGERRYIPVAAAHGRGQISTHAPLAGSDYNVWSNKPLLIISTHAPLAGSDTKSRLHPRYTAYFNPRSPRGERLPQAPRLPNKHHFNPRSPRGERLFCSDCGTRFKVFQPTLPSRGATIVPKGRKADIQFQPTLPSRGATCAGQ